MRITQEQLLTFGVSQALIWIPLFTGHWMRRAGWIGDQLAKPLHVLNLSLVSPVVYALGVWRLDRSHPNWYWVPLIMFLLMSISTVGAAWATPRFIRDRAVAGAFTIMIPLSNIGHTLAGFVALLLYAAPGYAQNTLLAWPMLLFNFLVWMPLARHWGMGHGQSFWRSFWQALLTTQSLIIVGMVIGTILNFARVPMAHGWEWAMKASVYVGTVLTMFAIGCRFRFRRVGDYHGLLAWVYLAKFLLHPLIALGLCVALGVHGMPAGVLFIAACAPTGVNTVIFATLYDLDVDLANAGYLWSTLLFMLVILPLLLVLLQAPFFQ